MPHFGELIVKPKPIIKKIKGANFCLISASYIKLMKEIFVELDEDDIGILKRTYFIKKLRKNSEIMKILDKPSIYIQELEKFIDLKRLLMQIEREQFVNSKETQNEKSFITWEKFINFIENYHHFPYLSKFEKHHSETSKKLLYFNLYEICIISVLVFLNNIFFSTYLKLKNNLCLKAIFIFNTN